MPSVHINGESKTVESTNIASLVNELNLQDKKITIELNLSIVEKSTYTKTALVEGDKLEIISFVGGG